VGAPAGAVLLGASSFPLHPAAANATTANNTTTVLFTYVSSCEMFLTKEQNTIYLK
jgi:hypothetical protein